MFHRASNKVIKANLECTLNDLECIICVGPSTLIIAEEYTIIFARKIT